MAISKPQQSVQDELRELAAMGRISTAVNPPIMMDPAESVGTATGKSIMAAMDRRIAQAMAGPFNEGKLLDAVPMRVFKAENGYALVIGEKLFVAADLKAVSDAVVSMLADWEMNK